MTTRRLAIALDIGGTNIKAGLIALDGEALCIERIPTPTPPIPESIVREVLRLIGQLLNQHHLTIADVDGVGISIAAFITANGVVTATAHLDLGWIGYDLRARLLRDLLTNYYFSLDTPAPTLGEAYYGAGKGIDDFCYVTVSTGIGAGILISGKYLTGGLGWAGGVGHIIIDETSERVCSGCGNHGCLETFAATQGIIATARELMRQNPDSLLAADSSLGKITPKLIFEAAQKGDEIALEVWRQAGHALGIGLTNLVDIVSPRRIVVGGGIAQAGDLLLEPARAVIRERAFPPQHRQAKVVQAALGDLSGAYGAAAMVFHDLRINVS
jgi:glucokinase